MVKWVNMYSVAKGWVASLCDKKKMLRFQNDYEKLRKGSDFVTTCVQALKNVGLKQEAKHLGDLATACQSRSLPDGTVEFDLGAKFHRKAVTKSRR